MKIDKYQNILDIVNAELAESIPTIDHTLRVYKNGLLIAQNEEDVDYEVLQPALLLHDIARVKASQQKVNHALLGAELAEEILSKLNYHQDKIVEIKKCIISHANSTAVEPESIEAKIIFDADKLDNIGVVGIAKSFMLAGRYKQRLIYPNPEGEHTPLLEYEQNLKKIPGKMYTKQGKELGYERLREMNEFFEKLKTQL